jgi:carbon-monoxide dehydrogenase large subunit
MPVGSILGRAVRRTEDPRLLRGAAAYVEDIPAEGALHAAFVRSILAHARLNGIDREVALAMPGVVGVYTASDIGLDPMVVATSVEEAFSRRPVLAGDVVRFVGEAIAVVVAQTRAQALDAAEAVAVDYDPLPTVADPLRAMEPGAPLLFPGTGTNVARERHSGVESGALDGADVTVRGRFVNQRLAPVPMEPNGMLAIPDGDGLLLYVPCQAPFWIRKDVAAALRLKEDRVRVIAPAVGGGFGAKADTYPEQLVISSLALRLGRPVRYTETRSENMSAMTHGRAQIQDVELGATRDGRIVGLRVEVVADAGAYPMALYLPTLTYDMACGAYIVPKVDFISRCVVTNTTPVAAYRGAGRPEAAALIERAMDMLAQELAMDPVEVRRRNLIPPGAFPHKTATDSVYDIGDYERALDLAIEISGYEGLRKEQAERRDRGDAKLLGVGVAVYVEVTGWGSEFGSVEVHADGTVTAKTGTSPHGQGHETAFAQIVAGTLGVPFDAVKVVHSDTALVARGDGTMGSRSLQLGGSAIARASEGVLDKARRLAAHLLESSEQDIEVYDGVGLGVSGAPDTAITWAELATAAADPQQLPEGAQPGLASETDFDMEERNTFPFGAHIAVVEVDAETGRTELLRHIAVDDCGRILNPMLVDGQVHGGVAQGAAQALYEEVLFDENGTPLTGNLMSYAMPSAADLPSFEIAHTETPTPLNPLGAKGIGEAGSIGSTPAVQNAVIDAVSHLGVRHIDMPLTPERVWRAIGERWT